jgi:hypothetical protein
MKGKKLRSSNNPIAFKYAFSIAFIDKNLEITGFDSYNEVVISNGINLLTENTNNPLIIKFQNYRGN